MFAVNSNMTANSNFRATIAYFPSMPSNMNKTLSSLWETATHHWDEAQQRLAAGSSPAEVGQLVRKANRTLAQVKRGLGLGKGTWSKSPLGQNWGCGCSTCISNTPHGKGASRERARSRDVRISMRDQE